VQRPGDQGRLWLVPQAAILVISRVPGLGAGFGIETWHTVQSVYRLGRFEYAFPDAVNAVCFAMHS